MVGRLAGLGAALALAAGCGKTVQPVPGPLDRFYKPTGVAVQRTGTDPGDARLLVVSTNGDIRYDSGTGGSLIALEGDFLGTGYRRSGAVNVNSFGGDLALARTDAYDPAHPDPAACGSAIEKPLAIFATRGSNTLNLVRIDDATGALECQSCGVPLAGTFADPLPVAVACNPGQGRASVFTGYLQGLHGEGWVTEYRLQDGATFSIDVGGGPTRYLAYDPVRDRLYVVGLATGSETPLRYIDLAGCTLGEPLATGGCAALAATQPVTFGSVELRAIALAAPVANRPQRAYLTARLYDVAAAASAGARTTDLGGKLFVVDLVEGPTGVTIQPVDEVDIGHGAQDVRILPRLSTWSAERGDVVAALAVEDALVWFYDTETRALASIGRDPVTGSALAGGYPYGLAVDPAPIFGAGRAARVYVGSYGDSYVIPIDVPLDDVDAAGFAGGTRHFLTGATP